MPPGAPPPPAMPEPAHAPRPSLRQVLPAMLLSMRPAQWTKNGVVAVPLFFAIWDRAQQRALILDHLGLVLLGVLAFCLVSSAVYVANDLCDVAQDRLHPEKRLRPIASGRLPATLARLLFPALLAAGLLLGAQVNRAFLAVVAGYALLQLIYSLHLKQVGLLDVFVIAAGFVLRAVAGARAAEVEVSAWLLLCTFLLALFLALCKRWHEKDCLGGAAAGHRATLAQYDLRGLDQFIGISATATIVCYAIYTQSPETVAKFGTRGLGYTVPFVVFGIFRYLDLLYRREGGGRPEKVLLGDPPLILTLLLYALSAWIAFRLGTTP